MPVTAETITDAQLRELARDSRMRVRVLAKLALGEAVTYKSDIIMREARARCAEILNARDRRDTRATS